jgi:2-(1,2-epoxy-1,2-dihydrophenyl)acetyl-CoA isomerase
MGKPTIAAIRGPAAGTGLVLAAACDLRIVSHTATFKTAFASAGRCGDPGGSYLLTQLVGPAKARELYLLDEKITAEAAFAMGLVTKLVPDEKLEETARALALHFARGPSLAYAGIKRNLNAAETGSLEETMAIEGPTNARASLSHDGKEAGRAFREKRPPQFRGY